MRFIGLKPGSELAIALFVFRKDFWAVAALSMLCNMLMLAPTMYMLQVFDRVLLSQSELTLVALSLIALYLYLVMALSEWLRSRVLINAGVRMDEKLSSRVFEASFDAQVAQTGVTSNRGSTDLIAVRQFLTSNGILAFFDMPWFPVYIAVLFILHPWLGYLALLFAGIQGLLAWMAHHQSVAPSQAAGLASATAHEYLMGKLRNVEALESMGIVGNLIKHWRIRHITYLLKSAQSQHVTQRITAISKAVRYSQQSLALGMGGLLAINGQISPGAMIAANLLMGRALSPIDTLASVWPSFFNAKVALLRLNELLTNFPPRNSPAKLTVPTGTIQLVDVVASVPRSKQQILKHIQLQLMPGTLTVILGHSGSGKSTLARVIVGIWPEVSGDVLLDGEPLNSWSQLELGPHIGYLPQDVELFDGTVAQNISRFAKLEPDKVIAAAKSTGLHEMIVRMPKGYDTPVGEFGGQLSGGQRQRIGLARAVYGSPAIVVLDEPNANLDDGGERALMDTLRLLRAQGKTVVLITHRPAAMSDADQLVMLEQGRISLVGPKDHVLLKIHEAKQLNNQKPAVDAAIEQALPS